MTLPFLASLDDPVEQATPRNVDGPGWKGVFLVRRKRSVVGEMHDMKRDL